MADPRDDPQRAAELLAELAAHHRILAVVIPRGVPTEAVLDLQRDVNNRLDALAERWRPQ